ncbi:MAG TPA: hypothetical protein VNF45_09485 [Candidatus Binataceae bacterium]|nr:hypothetical protein [Candidatus Binataceae bacterium]
MPRMKDAAATGSAFRQVQSQARNLLGQLRKEIHSKEMELARLKQEEVSLSQLTGRPQTVRGPRAASAGGGGRIDWRGILTELPKQFKAADIREIRGVKSKRPSEIFAAITRWIEAGLVKRKARGVYERV